MVNVAVGIVLDAEQNILITCRPKGKFLEGLWEFPGGKVEATETAEAALQRELQEEVGLTPLASSPLTEIGYDYEKTSVFLQVYVVTSYQGQAQSLEQQQLRWVPFADLKNYQFPKANTKIIEALKNYLSA